ncbi:hypothetical protein Tco_0832842 [Tanacetum coccineum]
MKFSCIEAHLAPKQPVQVNKITSSCEIYSGSHDTQYCMENPKQAFVDYASSRTDKAGEDPQCSTRIHSLINTITICPKRPRKFQNGKPEEEEQEEKDNPENINTNSSSPPDPSVLIITEKIIKKNDDSRKGEPEVGENAGVGELEVDYFVILPTRRKPFVEISNMTHDPLGGVVRLTNRTDKIAYKMPHKIEQYNSLSDLEREHTKSVYLRNKEDKRRGVEYVMSKILGFYKECLELGPEYLTRIADEREVT